MKDPRNTTLAKQLIDYSIELKKDEVIYIELKGEESLALGKELIAIATQRGAVPFWVYNDESMLRHFIKNGNSEQFKKSADLHLEIMKRSDAYISVRGSNNPFDLSDIPQETRETYQETFFNPVHREERVNNTKWVVLRYPNNAMAQLAETSQEAFEDFYFDVCCANYQKMSVALQKLKDLFEATSNVHIKSPGTDLQFSIKDIPAVLCDGKRNIPDGEVYSAPVRDSVNGIITFNTPSLTKDGILFSDIFFRFENGKIIEARCDGKDDALNKILDTDEGARFIGEFAIGVNPFILDPMRDTLFDEKIAGSFHLTPGQCYESASNSNSSTIHWDLVQIQRPEYGGGEIWFDGNLIRKDGKFTDEEMEQSFSKENLSPER